MVDELTYLLSVCPEDIGTRTPTPALFARDRAALRKTKDALRRLDVRVVNVIESANSLVLEGTEEEIFRLYRVAVERDGKSYRFEGTPTFPKEVVAAARGYSLSLVPNRTYDF